MKKSALKVVVLGDSAMWGQGLRPEEKYSTKSVQEIGQLLGRQAAIIVNSARSGAVIRAGQTPKESKTKRAEFVDTFPHLFDHNRRLAFVDGRAPASQDAALRLFHEHPASFPTVEKQVERVPDGAAEETDLVLLNGGANDLDFEEFLHPENHRHDFVSFYDPVLREITFARVRSLLRQARAKFPHAVLLYTGYFSPFAPGVANADLEDCFEYMSGQPEWEIWLNSNVVSIKDVPRLVIEAQYRAQFGAARGLYWTRRAIAEANADPAFRGPGLLFIHPQFGTENTVFGSNSFFHRQYEPSKVDDPARPQRIDPDNCPRIELADEMQSLLLAIPSRPQDPVIDLPTRRTRAASLRAKLSGPESLNAALDRLIALRDGGVHFADKIYRTEAEVADGLKRELKRINRVRIASFVHPNAKGAQRYTSVIVKRYTDRHRQVHLRDDVLKLRRAGDATPAGLRRGLARYGLAGLSSARAMTQLMLVDSIALQITTADDSDENMFDNVFLDLGTGLRWRLNFPYIHTQAGATGPVLDFKMLSQQFSPGATDLFTIDAGGFHLGRIARLRLETSSTRGTSGRWRPAGITLFVNGVEVFTSPFATAMPHDGHVNFPYPA